MSAVKRRIVSARSTSCLMGSLTAPTSSIVLGPVLVFDATEFQISDAPNRLAKGANGGDGACAQASDPDLVLGQSWWRG
jgi:hypothetical protein